MNSQRSSRLLRRLASIPGLILASTLLVATGSFAQSSPPALVYPGLWIGDVILQEVSLARTGAMQPTPSQAQLRLILHVDATGKVRLLKEAILAQPSLPDPDGPEVLLFSDVTRMAGKTVATDFSRGGSAKAQRLAAAAYDFKDTDGSADNALDLTGYLVSGGILEGTLLLDGRHPTNPFRHKFHPDHANEGAKAFEISRLLRIEFAGDPQTKNGVLRIQGNYTETYRGLHRADLVTKGFVTLTRISAVAVLNP